MHVNAVIRLVEKKMCIRRVPMRRMWLLEEEGGDGGYRGAGVLAIAA